MKGGKLLAKLHPRSPGYTLGTGGLPDMTAQDVSAALGMVPAGLGRELIIHAFWEDAAAVNAANLDRMLMDRQMREYSTRAEAATDAELAHAAAIANMPRSPDAAESLQIRARLARLTGLANAARANRWPRMSERYRLVRDAVLSEMVTGRSCPTCKGSRVARRHGQTEPCRSCSGTGHRRVSDRERARLLGFKHDTDYRRHWREVYEWTLDVCAAELSEAMALFNRAAA